MYKAILFDLDGTLLPLNTQQFLNAYLDLLKKEVKTLYDPEEFVKHVLIGSQKMIEYNGTGKTNQEIFFEYFFNAVSLPRTQITSFFNQFYREKFPKLKYKFNIDRDVILNIEQLMAELHRYSWIKKAIATNPVFPREAIKNRLNWIALEVSDFDLVTSYENMHSTKPNSDYYCEVADKLDLKCGDCLMVGNDTREDLIARDVGMDVFLVTENIIDPHGCAQDYPQEKKGDFSQLMKFLEKNL